MRGWGSVGKASHEAPDCDRLSAARSDGNPHGTLSPRRQATTPRFNHPSLFPLDSPSPPLASAEAKTRPQSALLALFATVSDRPLVLRTSTCSIKHVPRSSDRRCRHGRVRTPAGRTRDRVEALEAHIRHSRKDSRWRQVRVPADCSRVSSDQVQYRYLDTESFVKAIAPQGDLAGTKLGSAQYALLFRVADSKRRGLVSWEDFTVFETLLKRPDADYWIAFQYFDVYVLAYLPPFTIITP